MTAVGLTVERSEEGDHLNGLTRMGKLEEVCDSEAGQLEARAVSVQMIVCS